jgi:hypothetical protein
MKSASISTRILVSAFLCRRLIDGDDWVSTSVWSFPSTLSISIRCFFRAEVSFRAFGLISDFVLRVTMAASVVIGLESMRRDLPNRKDTGLFGPPLAVFNHMLSRRTARGRPAPALSKLGLRSRIARLATCNSSAPRDLQAAPLKHLHSTNVHRTTSVDVT